VSDSEIRKTGNPIALDDYLRNAHIEWHGIKLDQPD